MTAGFEGRKDAAGGAALRQAPRVDGPFEARRVDILMTALRIHDLSRSGCLIQWYHHQTPGRRFTLEFELPGVGWLRVEAEPIYNRSDYGFAAKFVEVPPDTLAKLDHVIEMLRSKGHAAP